MENEEAYQMFTLAGNEFAFDVDLSTVECGINSALYFVAMEPDGGMSSYPTNTAGAKYGTGYCDAQCARDLKFIGGEVNIPSRTQLYVIALVLTVCCNRPTSRAGSLPPAIPTLERVAWDLAALRSTSGSPTHTPMLSLPTLARTTTTTSARTRTVAVPTLMTVTLESVTPTAATTTLTAWATPTSTALA